MSFTVILICLLLAIVSVLAIVCFILFNKNDYQKKKELEQEIKKKDSQIKEQSKKISEQHTTINNTFDLLESRLLADEGVKNENIPGIVNDIKRSISYD